MQAFYIDVEVVQPADKVRLFLKVGTPCGVALLWHLKWCANNMNLNILTGTGAKQQTDIFFPFPLLINIEMKRKSFQGYKSICWVHTRKTNFVVTEFPLVSVVGGHSPTERVSALLRARLSALCHTCTEDARSGDGENAKHTQSK